MTSGTNLIIFLFAFHHKGQGVSKKREVYAKNNLSDLEEKSKNLFLLISFVLSGRSITWERFNVCVTRMEKR